MVSSDWAPAITFSVMAVTAGAAIVLRGPMGKALAEWIRGWSHTEAKWIEAKAASGEVAEHRESLQAELDSVRHELGELGERMDFAERMLAQSREQALPKGGSGRV